LGWTINKHETLEYLKSLKNDYSNGYYRKQIFQIKKFLRHLSIGWSDNIKAPSKTNYRPKRVDRHLVQETVAYFEDESYFPQYKALILLGATGGLRAEEIYQLLPEDIDLENRIVYINHNPDKGQTTKTRTSRATFFNQQCEQALREHFEFFTSGCGNIEVLFGEKHIRRAFSNAPIQVKDLRKFFSQEWERRNGSYAAKEILLGHSLKGSVDLQHYAYIDEEDLKKIYDKVNISVLP